MSEPERQAEAEMIRQRRSGTLVYSRRLLNNWTFPRILRSGIRFTQKRIEGEKLGEATSNDQGTLS